MTTQNKKKILDLGFLFNEPKSIRKQNRRKLHRRNSHITHRKLRKSQMRATYNSMFYGF
ncbi:MAG: hypothetical protein ACTSO5_15025 [Candidatus Heimdallarchaeaceae archaeon]